MDEDRRVLLAVKIGGQTVNVVIRLLIESAAKESIRNFHRLITSNIANASYRSTKFSRLVSPEFIIQGGKIEGFTGDVLVKSEVTPETTVLDQKGLVVLASEIEDQVPSSEFFITLQDLSEFKALKGRFLVVGQVVNGLDQLVELTKNISVDEDDTPLEDIIISRTGELIKKKKRQEKTEVANLGEIDTDITQRKEPGYLKSENKSDSLNDESGSQRPRHHSHRNSHHSRHSLGDGRDRMEPKREHKSDGSGYYRDSSRKDHHKRGLEYQRHRDDYMDRDPKRLRRPARVIGRSEERKGRGFKW